MPRVAPAPARPMARVEATGPKPRFLLWVNGVGGYLVCMDDRIVLGRAGPDSHADIPLMGDLSRNHAMLLRNGEGYLLQAHQASFVNGKPVVDQVVLHDGDVIRLGSTVERSSASPAPSSRRRGLDRQPAPSPPGGQRRAPDGRDLHRRRRGPRPRPGPRPLQEPIVLYRQAGSLWCRAAGAFDVDGRTCAAPRTLDLAFQRPR